MEGLLPEMLAVAVPLWIMRYIEMGGPSVEDMARCHVYEEMTSESILYRIGKPGQTAKAFNQVAESIAVLSFIPGGVTIFGNHWETKPMFRKSNA